MSPARGPESRGTSVIDGAMALIVVLLIVQMWLLSSALEAYLAGYRETALPGAIVSGVVFLACAALYRFIGQLDGRS